MPSAALADLPHGWFNHGPQVLALLEQHRPRVVVELGSWMGASAIAMARMVRQWGGTVTCVDTWCGELDENGASPEPFGKSPLMLVTCARAMVMAGISASVRLIPALTVDAARHWQGPIDFLYVDAGHGYDDVLADLEAWVPHVRSGGMIVGDDYGHPRYPGVKLAWEDYAQAHGLRLERFQSTPARPDGVELIVGTV